MFAFNVYDNIGRKIDTVFYQIGKTETREQAVETVRLSLVNHEGCPQDIKVTWPKGQRITVDSFEIHGNYGQGFEMVTAETTRKEAKIRLREYRDNEPGIPFKLVKKQERA